jgi:hypothetical protein
MKCCPCLDDALAAGAPAEDVPEAVTMAATVQGFTVNGQPVMAPVTLPVCAECRKRQIGVKSKTGLIAV